MKCFHFPNADNGSDVEAGSGPRIPRIPWARSLSVASGDTRHSDSIDSGTTDGMDFSSGWNRQGSGFGGLRPFGFAELRSATRGFSRALLIGEGGFGCVYRGVVDDDDGGGTMDVAVKQLNRNGLQGHKEWITEVKFMGIVKHPNLVKLIGYCAEDDERGIQRLLVYELMPNKSLENHLLVRVQSPLSWTLRLRIAQDAARGLAYLHEEMDFQLIFRDFKTSNILLDGNFNAKLSDFGMARPGPAEGLDHVSTSVVGTVGYAAPEYIQSGKLNAKSDVWSFGVVLYELITGRRSMDRNLPRGEQNLLDWVRPYATDPKKISMIIDHRLEGQYNLKSAQKLIALANKCLLKQPKNRPKMSEVFEILGQIIDVAEEKPDFIDSIQSNEGAIFDDADASKQGSLRKRVLVIKEFISLRKRSVGRLDWRMLTPALTRTCE